MYLKGIAFLRASALLYANDRSEPSDYVSLHLLCQGIELILKGFLMLRDYAAYPAKKLSRSPFGHDLQRLLDETLKAYGLKPIRGAAFNAQFTALAQHFGGHELRYAGVLDIFIAPNSIPRVAVWRKVAAAVRLAERELRDSGTWTPSRTF